MTNHSTSQLDAQKGLAFTLGTSEDEAARRFKQRFGYPHTRIVRNSIMILYADEDVKPSESELKVDLKPESESKSKSGTEELKLTQYTQGAFIL